MAAIAWSQIDLFRDLSAGQLELVKPIFREVVCQAGERVVTEGEPGDEMFILVSGRVRIFKAMLIEGMQMPLQEMTNTRKVLANLTSEGYPIFGEMALLDRDHRSATVEAVERCRFLSTDRASFDSLAAREPVVGSVLYCALGRRLAGMVRRNNVEIVKLTSALVLALSGKR
jgi:CRP-like cAMP-binding protein